MHHKRSGWQNIAQMAARDFSARDALQGLNIEPVNVDSVLSEIENVTKSFEQLPPELRWRVLCRLSALGASFVRLSVVTSSTAQRGDRGELATHDEPREAHPVGNTGGTSQIPQTGRGALSPVLGFKNHG